MSFNISYNFQAIDDFSPALNKMGKSFSRLSSKITNLSSKIGRVGEKMSKFGKSFSLKVGAPVAAFGALSIHTAQTFDESMNMVKAVTNTTGTDMDKMRKKAMYLGKTTQFHATDAAKAMTAFGLAGMNTSQILAATPKALNIAAAAQISMGDAASSTMNIMHAFGGSVKDIDKYTDILSGTFTSTNTNFTDLTIAMRNAAPTAHMLGISVSETSAALGLMAQKGFTGADAGTKFKMALTKMAAPTADAKKLMDQLGLTFVDQKGKALDLVTIFKEIAAAHLTTAGYAKIFGDRAYAVVAAVADQADSLDALNKKLLHTKGLTKRLAQTQMEGLPGQIKTLGSAFESFRINIVETNHTLVSGILKSLTSLFLSLNNTSPAFKKIIGNLGALFIVTGPVLLGFGKLLIIMKLMGGWGVIASIFKNLGIAAKFMWRGLLGPIGIIITLVGIIYLLYKRFKIVRTVINALGKAIYTAYIVPFKLAIKWAKELWGWLKKIFHHGKKTPIVAIKHTTGTYSVPPSNMGFGGGGNVAIGTYQPQKTMSTLNINVHDPHKTIKSMHGESTADDFGMNVGTNMSYSRI